ncbi:MAG: alpha-L-fucosidase, partial [Dysgonamonadaceae bacterium]|nr:alpha-L-fucosidase [Dysgonamonadaceae bacterium]
MKTVKTVVCAVAIWFAIFPANGQPDEKRGRFFEWGNYAMFIHWGLYSAIANEWEGNTFYGNS